MMVFPPEQDIDYEYDGSMDMLEGLEIGRIVHYVMVGGRSQGQSRPAIIVRIWPTYTVGEVPLINMQVFTDNINDGNGYENGMFWATSVHYGENNPDGTYPPGTWHWAEWS